MMTGLYWEMQRGGFDERHADDWDVDPSGRDVMSTYGRSGILPGLPGSEEWNRNADDDNEQPGPDYLYRPRRMHSRFDGFGQHDDSDSGDEDDDALRPGIAGHHTTDVTLPREGTPAAAASGSGSGVRAASFLGEDGPDTFNRDDHGEGGHGEGSDEYWGGPGRAPPGRPATLVRQGVQYQYEASHQGGTGLPQDMDADEKAQLPRKSLIRRFGRGEATAWSLLRQQGWRPGKGLGRSLEGITQPIPLEWNYKNSGIGYGQVREARKRKAAKAVQQRLEAIDKETANYVTITNVFDTPAPSREGASAVPGLFKPRTLAEKWAPLGFQPGGLLLGTGDGSHSNPPSSSEASEASEQGSGGGAGLNLIGEADRNNEDTRASNQ